MNKSMSVIRHARTKGLILVTAALLAACSSKATQSRSIDETFLEIDGSSTVYPITQKMAEKFNAEPGTNVELTPTYSGTGGGFKRFCAGESDINNASRPILKSEMELCKQNNVAYIELPIAFDALTVVVNGQNTWASEMTTAELKKIWEPAAQQKITQWSQVRSSWPDKPLVLFGPGADSGTYDYFTDVIVGQVGASRSDYIASEDDELLAKGVEQNPNALGYFGYAYYLEHQDKLKALGIDNGEGIVLPLAETVQSADYQPLARPLFIYINVTAAQKNPLMVKFLDYYMRNAAEVVESVGYIAFKPEDYMGLYRNFHKTKTGTVFGGEPQPNLTIKEVLTKQSEY
ncbi:MAG: PstS family phosphate ABC transporter substrate-binding protein [Oscillatoriales cyanobacterium RM2_1_1]|nr:PstS family phosphate ABC transporter substrate-binding protein [Oscillatoriales cyanobacterium SM2_3_0]NJO47140.1 PstS family phosphate ABC transporter substrate-binding protein [Oscillatoriales cyanobacterium RM2_1_1]